MAMHCMLHCPGFGALAEDDQGFKAEAEACTHDGTLFQKIQSLASDQPSPLAGASQSNDNAKVASKLVQRDLSAAPVASHKCQAGYQPLFHNAMRPVLSYSHRRFGSVVSDPSSIGALSAP